MATRAANKRVCRSILLHHCSSLQTVTKSSQLTREYQTIQQNPPPYIIAHPSESNILEFVPFTPFSPRQFTSTNRLFLHCRWHYILTGPPKTPYENGQYWGTLLFPPNYPFAPPAIRMHTPSGRFQPSTRLCLSISDFHPKSFNPAWEVSTILIGLMSFMTSDEMTTGSVHATDPERRWAAARTRWWNSTGGGSFQRLAAGVNPSARGVGAVKAGDGGVKFKAEWPELDAENWAWMKTNLVDPTTGNLLPDPDSTSSSLASCSSEVAALRRGPGGSGVGFGTVVGGGHAATQAGQSWIRRHKMFVGVMVVICYVLLARLMGEVPT